MLDKKHTIAMFVLLISLTVVDAVQMVALMRLRNKQAHFVDKVVYWQYMMQAACHYEKGQISVQPELL